MIDWMWSHPWICLAVFFILYFIIRSLNRNDQIVSTNGGQEADQPDEVVYKKVSIFAPDGKLLESVLIDEDTLYYGSKSVEGVNDAGKEIRYNTLGFLVKIEEL